MRLQGLNKHNWQHNPPMLHTLIASCGCALCSMLDALGHGLLQLEAKDSATGIVTTTRRRMMLEVALAVGRSGFLEAMRRTVADWQHHLDAYCQCLKLGGPGGSTVGYCKPCSIESMLS